MSFSSYRLVRFERIRRGRVVERRTIKVPVPRLAHRLFPSRALSEAEALFSRIPMEEPAVA